MVEKYCDEMSVSLSVCSHNLKITRPNFVKLIMHVVYGPGLFLLWLYCDTLCTSGFVDVMFLCHGFRGLESSTTLYTVSQKK